MNFALQNYPRYDMIGLNLGGLCDMKARVDEYRQGRWRIKAFGEQIYSIEVQGKWIPLSSKELASFLCMTINRESTNPGFDIQDYKSTRDKTFFVDHAVDSWLKSATCSIDTLAPRERYAEIFRNYWKGWDIRQITTSHINEFYVWLKQTICKTGKPYSDKTLKNIMAELRGLFNYNSDTLGRMPKFPKIIVQESVKKWLTEQQQDEVFEFIPKEHLPIFTFQRWTACRPNEARGLLKKNVFRDKGYVVIATVYGNSGLKPITKTKQARPLEIIPEIADAVRPRDATPFVFTIHNHPYSRRTHEKTWNTANLRAHEKHGTPVVSLYPGTKHSFGHQRLDEGFLKEEVQAVMGHSSSKTTDLYAKYMTHKLANVMRGKVAMGLQEVVSDGKDKI